MRQNKALRQFFLLGLLALLFLAIPAGTYAGVQDITIVNRTGVYIYGLYISPSNSESWEEDLMGMDVLAPGDSIDISFDGYNRKNCYWDIMITDENDDGLTWEGLNLCEIWRVTLRWNGKKGWADLE